MSALFSSVYPPTAFYFRVVFSQFLGLADTSFQEVSGISSEMQTEKVVEGGENRFVHHLPTGVCQTPLVLQRGVGEFTSPLVQWCRQTLESDFAHPVRTQTLIVQLLNAQQQPLRAWSFANAYPVQWQVEPFNSTKNDVAIEKIVIQYSYSNRLI